MIQIVPSILSADFTRLGEQISDALSAGAARIQVDVMDGHFVPNISMGPLVVRAVRPLLDRFGAKLEVHLMVAQPERFLKEFRRAGADTIVVHVEACPRLHHVVQTIHDLGAAPGVALNPATPLLMLEEILPYVDQVLLMTVDPGAGGQEFMPLSLDKIARLREMLTRRSLDRVELEVDGGINRETIGPVAQAGATIAVAGSAVFGGPAPIADNLQALRSAVGERDRGRGHSWPRRP